MQDVLFYNSLNVDITVRYFILLLTGCTYEPISDLNYNHPLFSLYCKYNICYELPKYAINPDYINNITHRIFCKLCCMDEYVIVYNINSIEYPEYNNNMKDIYPHYKEIQHSIDRYIKMGCVI